MPTIKYYLQNFGISKKERKIEDRILLAKYSNRDNIKFLDLLQFYKKLSYNREEMPEIIKEYHSDWW